MSEEKTVSATLYERTQVRHERTIKRLVIALIISAILIFASNALWLYAWMQYDYTSTETESVIEQNAEDGGNANYIGNNGEINNGLPKGD